MIFNLSIKKINDILRILYFNILNISKKENN